MDGFFFLIGGKGLSVVVVNDLIGKILGEWCLGLCVNVVDGLPLFGLGVMGWASHILSSYIASGVLKGRMERSEEA
jgi:hypothetical protein